METNRNFIIVNILRLTSTTYSDQLNEAISTGNSQALAYLMSEEDKFIALINDLEPQVLADLLLHLNAFDEANKRISPNLHKMNKVALMSLCRCLLGSTEADTMALLKDRVLPVFVARVTGVQKSLYAEMPVESLFNAMKKYCLNDQALQKRNPLLLFPAAALPANQGESVLASKHSLM